MAIKLEFNDNTPSAPTSRTNVKWQYDANGNISANVASPVITILVNGITLPNRSSIEFIGIDVSVIDDPDNDKLIIQIG